MNQRTDLSGGAINGNDRIVVELIEPPDTPPIVAITWPTKPSVCTPDVYANVTAACMQVLSAAVIELAALRRRRRL
jgi:hypothetical protein